MPGIKEPEAFATHAMAAGPFSQAAETGESTNTVWVGKKRYASMLNTEKRSRRVPLEHAASPLEVSAAIGALEPAQLLRLKKYAGFRVRGLGRKAAGRTYQDLLNDALIATLDGSRRWHKDAVDLVGHLLGAMRSISSHWGEEVLAGELFLESEGLGESQESLLGQMPSSRPDAERELVAKDELERIKQHFADDPLVLAIIDAAGKGMKGPEVQAALAISKTDYETAFKRLRRGVERLDRQGDAHA